MAGEATEVTDRYEFDEISKVRLRRFPEYSILRPSLGDATVRISPKPPLESVALLRIVPQISVLDYSKGFGHSGLVTFSSRDLNVHLESVSRPWNGIIGRSGPSSKDT